MMIRMTCRFGFKLSAANLGILYIIFINMVLPMFTTMFHVWLWCSWIENG